MDSYKRLIQTAHQALKPRGYKKIRNSFVTTGPGGNLGFIAFVQPRVTNGIYSDSVRRFTVEVSIASKKLLDQFRTHLYYSAPDKPDYTNSHYSERLGYILGYKCDHWWDLHPENEEVVIGEVVAGISGPALDVIGRELTDEAMCDRRLKWFNANQRQSPADLMMLAFLLREFGDVENFTRVADYTYKTFGGRGFETSSTIADYLVGLGFETGAPRPKLDVGPYDRRFWENPREI